MPLALRRGQDQHYAPSGRGAEGFSRCLLFQAYSFGHGIVDGQTDQIAYQGGCAAY